MSCLTEQSNDGTSRCALNITHPSSSPSPQEEIQSDVSSGRNEAGTHPNDTGTSSIVRIGMDGNDCSSSFTSEEEMVNMNEKKRPRDITVANDTRTGIKTRAVPLVERSVVTICSDTSSGTTTSTNTTIVSIDTTERIAVKNNSNDEMTPPSHDINHPSRRDSLMTVSTSTADANEDMNHQHCDVTIPLKAMTKTNPPKSFAPSIQEYLKQEKRPSCTSREKSGDFRGLPYLPRPEWFGIVNYIMKEEIEEIQIEHGSDCLQYELSRMVRSFKTHLEFCVASEYVYNEAYLDSSGSDYDSDDNCIRMCSLDWCDSGEQFRTVQLTSRALYFDINEYIWKTYQIQSHNQIAPRNNVSSKVDDMDIDTMLSSNEHPYQITYDALIRRQHRGAKQRIGREKDTILHAAIKENADVAAMEIIQIEYKTFLDCVRRNDHFKNQLHLTLLNATNRRGYTPIVIAAQMGNFKIMKELLQCGVSICHSSKAGSTGSLVLHAAKYRRDEMIEYIIEYHQLNNKLRSRVTLASSWPKTLKDLVDDPSRNGTTPLMVAAQGGHVSTVKLLLKYGATVRCQNSAGMTPLMFASRFGSVAVCRLLIDAGATFHATTERNTNALLLACKCGHLDVVKELVAAGSYLHQKDDRNFTAQQVVRRRIQRRNVVSATTRSIYYDELDDDVSMENINVGPLSTDQNMLFLLDPPTQVELMQFAARVKRNYEMIRTSALVQQNRADIQLRDGSTSDIPTVIEWLTSSTTGHSSDSSTSMLPDPQLSKLPKQFTLSSTQMLLRTMLLPVPIMQTIALFLPLPPLWGDRIGVLESWTCDDCPNEAIVCALDIIDEILEYIGFLSACDAAKIPAPKPHRTWMDWKNSAKSRATSDRILPNDNPYHPVVLPHLRPPSPHDENNPTLCELRRMAGYLPLLSQNESHTDIVTILTEPPYDMNRNIVDRLIGIADVASICRRCCIQPMMPLIRDNGMRRCIEFDTNIASDVISLAGDLHYWHHVCNDGRRNEDSEDEEAEDVLFIE